MKNRPFYLYFMALSSVLFTGCTWFCDNPKDTDTASYMLTRADVNVARSGANGLKIIDINRDGDVPGEFLVIPVGPGGTTVGTTAFKGSRRCPPYCLSDIPAATAPAGLEPHPMADYPADRVNAARGILIPAGVLDAVLDSCVNYVGISSEPGSAQIKVTGITTVRNPGARVAVPYP